MPSPVLDVNAVVMCLHSGKATFTPSSLRVRVSGIPVTTVADVSIIAGCSLASVPAPPCVSVAWMAPAQRVKVMGSPVVLVSSQGMGVLAPARGPIMPPSNGPVTVVPTQLRVKGT